MLFENDKIGIGHCFVVGVNLVGLISRGNIQIHHRYRCQSVGISISYLHLTSRLNSKWLDLILALNHFSRQSAATSSSQLNISDIAISFFFL